MTTKAQKIRLGIFAVAAGALMVLVLVVFAGLRLWEHHERYRIVFGGSVLGLEEGADVTFAGIRVGSIASIGLMPGDASRVQVVIEVEPGLPIHRDTTASLSMAGITGLKVIDLKGGSAAMPRLPPGATIAAGEATLDRVQRQAQAVIDQTTEIMGRANQVMQNLEQITAPGQYASIGEFFDHARVASEQLAATTTELHALVSENRTKVGAALADFDQLTHSARGVLTTDMPRLVASASALVDDVRGVVRADQSQLASSLFDLRQASRSFKDLARDLRQRPSRLLMSSAPPGRRLP
jgi:phospholipid/cholesterol/gamma-HCH transport system substrate-binding protein